MIKSMENHDNPPVVEAHHLSKQFIGPQGSLSILKDIDMLAQGSEAVAILGVSGVGKSTLLGLLAGLDTPSSGSVHLFGEDLNGLDEDGRAKLRAGQVGFVFQSFQLISGLTALENVMMPLELNGQGRKAYSSALESLGRVGLAGRASHYPHQLSGGEQQRVAIARAFAPRPQVLFADEPTGNLDQTTGHRVIELMFSLRDEYDTTMVMVTHDHELTTQCDRCYRLHAGKLESV
jgi:putative ABC transport system ATP-binding protein